MNKLFIICTILLFLVTSGQAVGPISSFQDKIKSSQDNGAFVTEEITNPDFLDSLCFLPVKFLKQEGEILKAEFPSRNVTVVLDFKFLPNERGSFLKLGQTSEERIDQGQFLKKFKNDFWWIVYRPVGEDNFIYEAHQIKSLLSLESSYAYDPYDNYQRVKNYPFWQAMKVMVVQIHHLDKSNNKFSWVFITPIIKEREPALYNELATLKDNYDKAIQKLKSEKPKIPVTGIDISKELGLPADEIFINVDNNGINPKIIRTGTDISIITRQDTSELHPYCVFSISTRDGKETRVDRNFFESNFDKYNWIIFYNPESKIVLRMVALSSEEPSKTPK